MNVMQHQFEKWTKKQQLNLKNLSWLRGVQLTDHCLSGCSLEFSFFFFFFFLNVFNLQQTRIYYYTNTYFNYQISKVLLGTDSISPEPTQMSTTELTPQETCKHLC